MAVAPWYQASYNTPTAYPVNNNGGSLNPDPMNMGQYNPYTMAQNINNAFVSPYSSYGSYQPGYSSYQPSYNAYSGYPNTPSSYGGYSSFQGYNLQSNPYASYMMGSMYSPQNYYSGYQYQPSLNYANLYQQAPSYAGYGYQNLSMSNPYTQAFDNYQAGLNPTMQAMMNVPSMLTGYTPTPKPAVTGAVDALVNNTGINNYLNNLPVSGQTTTNNVTTNPVTTNYAKPSIQTNQGTMNTSIPAYQPGSYSYTPPTNKLASISSVGLPSKVSSYLPYNTRDGVSDAVYKQKYSYI